VKYFRRTGTNTKTGLAFGKHRPERIASFARSMPDRRPPHAGPEPENSVPVPLLRRSLAISAHYFLPIAHLAAITNGFCRH
jgi:hypothetical protein